MDQYKSFDAQHGGDVNQGAAPLFPPLVRPTPSYPHTYATILGPGSNGSDARSSQAAFYDQESLAFGPTIMSTWGAATTAESGAFDPQTGGNNYDYAQAAAERAIEASVYNHHLRQFQMDNRASNNIQPFPPSSRLSHNTASNLSPNLFGNHQHLQQVPQLSFPPNLSQPSSTSASPASINSRPRYSIEPKAQALSSAIVPFNTSPVSSSSVAKFEPADAPWNLVPYSLLFAAGRGNGAVPGDASGAAAGTNQIISPLMSPHFAFHLSYYPCDHHHHCHDHTTHIANFKGPSLMTLLKKM